VRAALAAGLALGLLSNPGWAGSLRYCDGETEPTAAVQDRLIQVAGIIKDELDRSGQRVAIVSRSGLALQHLDQRYSHAGVSLKGSSNAPWSVRQLYYACDEQRPRIFDQGMSGFVLGAHDPGEGYVSIVLLPGEAALALERTALSDVQALQLLGTTYSANAHAYSQRYQNCNQWLAELLAIAWGRTPQGASAPLVGATTSVGASDPREQAQQWLRAEGYQPSVLKVVWQPLMWVAALLPWLHSDDHPQADLAQAQFQVSMPQSIESFVRGRLPEATHMELCYTEQRVVLRRGWEPIAPGCQSQSGDDLISLRN
jgi:hypothetical protein